MLGEVVIAIGGDHGRGSQTSTKIYALCEDPLSWVEVGCLPVPLSYSCAVTLSDREVVVIGGRDKSGNDTDIVYRIALQENENPV
jgi:N-acetylneuraminic acid mutarotase